MRVAIYSRKSIETDKGSSIKNQIEMCKEYFERREDNVVFEIFEDEGFTGANTNRPSFQLMMHKANNKEFDIVAVYRLDRVSRNVLDFLNFHDTLKKLDIKFVSITESFDTSTSMGQMMLLMISGFAQMERENIAQRVKDNMRELAKNGKWTGGTLPFGYTTERIKENNKQATYLKANESKKEVIESIFNYYLKTQSMHQVQKWLYTNDIKWNLSTIKNILTSPVYVKANENVINYLKNFGEVFGNYDNIHGLISYNRRPYTNGKHRWNDKSMFFSVSKHEGIIDPLTWLAVQNVQNKNKTTPRPKQSQVSYLTRVLKCAKCGSSMTISYNHKNKDGSITYVYLCTGRKTYGNEYCNCRQIKQSLYDEKFLEQLTSYANLPFKEFVKVAKNKVIPIKKNNPNYIKKKIASNEFKIANLTDKLSELSNAAGKPLMKKLEILTNENEELKKQLFLMQQEETNNSEISVEFIYNRIKDFLNVFNNLSVSEKREWISSFIETICYDSDTMNSKITFL